MNKKTDKLHIFSPEVLLLQRPDQYIQKSYIDKMNQNINQLLFTVVKSGHWMSILVLKKEDTIIIIDSRRKLRYHDIVDKICRLLRLSTRKFKIKVQQQDNNFDCGAYTAAFMLALAKYFSGISKKFTEYQILCMLKKIILLTQDVK